MIYLIDTIGNETGMHLYDAAFCHVLQEHSQEVTVLSNYDTDQQRAAFPNFYRGGGLTKIRNFATALWRVLACRCRHAGTRNVYVYQSFGLRPHDMLFLMLMAGHRRLVVIVHDIYEITDKGKTNRLRPLQNFLYRHYIRRVICHNRAVQQQLRDLGYTGQLCYTPHFSYDFSKDIDMQQVQPEIISAIASDKPNFLFFGQVRHSKGITYLLEAIRILEREGFDGANIIIAGNDKGRLIEQAGPLPGFVHTVLRFIDDNELNYLFNHCQEALLPYTEIFQSGVLEAVIYFRLHAMLSDIAFFHDFHQQYPSFCSTFAPNDAEALAQAIRQACSSDSSILYYNDRDLEQYRQDHDTTPLAQFLSC